MRPGFLHSAESLQKLTRCARRLIPLVAAKTGLVSLILSLPTLPRESLFCVIDGFSRIMGMTTLGVDVVLTHPNEAVRSSPWAMILVAFLSGGGGGMLVPMFKMFGPEWGFTTTPAFVKTGLPIDVWSAAFIGCVYACAPSLSLLALSLLIEPLLTPLLRSLCTQHPHRRAPLLPPPRVVPPRQHPRPAPVRL